MDWTGSIIAGVVSGLIASAVFLLALRWIRPKILIAQEVSVYPSDDNGDEVLRIKIVNLRYRAVADISVELFVEHSREVHGGAIKVRKGVGSKFVSHVQGPRKLRDKEFDNARRIRIHKEELIQALAEKPNGYLLAEVFARDAVSGVGAIFTRKYALSTDMFKLGSYEYGNSVKIVPYQTGQQFKLPAQLDEARRAGRQAQVTVPESGAQPTQNVSAESQ